MLSRRCLLAGCVRNMRRPQKEKKSIHVFETNFRCDVSLISDEDEHAYCLRTFVEWWDPVEETTRKEVQQKWYIVESSDVV